MREWWRGGVIYQVYPRSFQDTNGDGVGDLPGILRRLDHIASLGVDAIWLSPITQSPQADMGYDVSDYKEVDRLFGTLEDFDDLVERAHALGLKVIMDQVLSHTSDKHPWFRESRLSRTNSRADWYVWADPKRDGTPPNNWPSVFGGRAWEWNPSRGQYYLHNFLDRAARPQFPQSGCAGRRSRRAALLAGARRRRFPARHRQLLFPRCELRSNPAGAAAAASALRGQPLRHAGAQILQEPARECRVPQAGAEAAGRVPGHDDRRAKWATAISG